MKLDSAGRNSPDRIAPAVRAGESVNIYLVRLAEGYLLIDCGMDTAAFVRSSGAGHASSLAGVDATSGKSC